jgi:PiT family inorganic phosphate transporter
VILVGIAALIYLRSRGSRVGHDNVNSEWTGSVAPAEDTVAEPAAA